MRRGNALAGSLVIFSLLALGSGSAKAGEFRTFLLNWPGYLATWHQGEGVPGAEKSNHALHLEKTGPADPDRNNGAAAVIDGVDGLTLTELGFDVRDGAHCAADVPRYEVETDNGTEYYFGCASASSVRTPLAGWGTRVRFTDLDAKQQCPQAACIPVPFVFGTAKARYIVVRFVLPVAAVGATHLDNLDVNGTLIGTRNG